MDQDDVQNRGEEDDESDVSDGEQVELSTESEDETPAGLRASLEEVGGQLHGAGISARRASRGIEDLEEDAQAEVMWQDRQVNQVNSRLHDVGQGLGLVNIEQDQEAIENLGIILFNVNARFASDLSDLDADYLAARLKLGELSADNLRQSGLYEGLRARLARAVSQNLVSQQDNKG